MSKGVLIICQHFVPYTPSVGGVARVAYLAKQLAEQGIGVHVLTSNGFDYGYLGFDDAASKAEITYLNDPLKYSVQSGLQRATSASSATSSRFSILSILRFFKKVVRKLVIPDLGLFMVPAYYRAASRLVQSGRYQTVIVSTPPHSMQLVGYLLKAKFGTRIKLVADYRDSWNTSTIFAQEGPIGGYLSRRLESATLSKADLVTFVSNPMIVKMDALYPDLALKDKSLLVMNGFAGNIAEHAERKYSSPIKIGYFGMADDDRNGYRNVEPLFESVRQAIENGVSIAVEFYGELRLSRLKLEDYPFVSVRGSVPHAEVLGIMQKMDYLLILHTDPSNSDEVITGKFFDYLQARRPICCFSPMDMEAARMVEQHGLGVWVNSESLDDAAKAIQSLPEKVFHNLDDDSFVSSYGRSAQYEKLMNRVGLS